MNVSFRKAVHCSSKESGRHSLRLSPSLEPGAVNWWPVSTPWSSLTPPQSCSAAMTLVFGATALVPEVLTIFPTARSSCNQSGADDKSNQSPREVSAVLAVSYSDHCSLPRLPVVTCFDSRRSFVLLPFPAHWDKKVVSCLSSF